MIYMIYDIIRYIPGILICLNLILAFLIIHNLTVFKLELQLIKQI